MARPAHLTWRIEEASPWKTWRHPQSDARADSSVEVRGLVKIRSKNREALGWAALSESRVSISRQPGPNPLGGIDAALAERLLGEALASGGEYADLYFEFRCAADFVLEEAQVRSVGRATIVGLGCASCAGCTATPTPRNFPRRA